MGVASKTLISDRPLFDDAPTATVATPRGTTEGGEGGGALWREDFGSDGYKEDGDRALSPIRNPVSENYDSVFQVSPLQSDVPNLFLNTSKHLPTQKCGWH